MLRWRINGRARAAVAVAILTAGLLFVGMYYGDLKSKVSSKNALEHDLHTDERLRDKILVEFHQKNYNETKTKRLADIIGIGAEKCGTGWLQFALQHHPMIQVGLNEVQFFNHEAYKRGMEHYRNRLPGATRYEVVMEKTPGYFNLGSMETPKRIKSHLPKVKLWLILCEPAFRTFSDFVHEAELKHSSFSGDFDDYVDRYITEARLRFAGSDEHSFESLVKGWHNQDMDSHILTLGAYYYSLKRWMKYFSSEQLLVISGEELQRNSGKVVEQVQEFLGIPKMLLEEDFVKNPETGLYCIIPRVVVDSKVQKGERHCYTATAAGVKKGRTRSNSTSHRPSPQKIETLKSFFKPHDELLFSYLGRRLW